MAMELLKNKEDMGNIERGHAKTGIASLTPKKQKEITFEEAKADEKLRERYLSQLKTRQNQPTINKIVYTKSQQFEAEYKAEFSSYGVKNAKADSISNATKNKVAFVNHMMDMLGSVAASNIYVRPGLFDECKNERQFLSVIEHETIHTLQNKRGVEVGSMTINFRNFRLYSLRLIVNVLEAEAYVHQIKLLNGLKEYEMLKQALDKFKGHHLGNMLIDKEEATENNKQLIRAYYNEVFKPVQGLVEKYFTPAVINGQPAWIPK